MNKSELVQAVASDAGVSRSEAEGVLSSFFETVKTEAKGGGSVAWPGFGKFSTSARAARTGRNPRTGEAVKIKASTAMKFTPSAGLKELLNTKGSPKKKKAAAKKTAAPAASGSKATASKTGAEQAPAKKAPAKKAPASKASASKAPAKKAPAKRSSS